MDKYKGKGLTGLANVGNSCYLNSCMQILSHTYELNDFLDKEQYKKHINKSPDSVILLEWDKLRRMMWSNNCTIAPHGFVNSIKRVSILKQRDLFVGNMQNDIQEFLLFIFECFHNALSRPVDMHVSGTPMNDTDKLATKCYAVMKNMYEKEYSDMLNLFYGIHVSIISSHKDGKLLSVCPEPFSILSLPIPDTKNVTLLDCVNLYCFQEELIGENAWMNDETGKKEDVRRGIAFWSLPTILIIDLKRWLGFGNKKNNALIETPLCDLDLSSHVKGYNKGMYVYDLYGVCNHIGGTFGGHYTASIKNANDKWYNFNDTNVMEVAENKVITNCSYCLFYRKKI